MGGASTPRRSASSGLTLLVAGVIVAVFGMVAAVLELGSTTDVTTTERLAGEPVVAADEAPPPSVATSTTVSTAE